MDEVHGILPPHPANPPTKGPLLTLFKQGRAFGVGAWLATQNPVDLDYKALGNAGVKLVGRLITDRDRERALEGLGMGVLDDGRDADDVVAQLGKRQFLLDDVREEPRVRSLSSRWAMSYLRGPVTLSEMAPLVGSARTRAAGQGASGSPERATVAASAVGADSPPVLQRQVTTRFHRVANAEARPFVVIRNRFTVSRKSPSVTREYKENWWIPVDEEGVLRWGEAELLDAVPDLAGEPPDGMSFPKAAPPRLGDEVVDAKRDFVVWRARRPVELLANLEFDLVAEPDESRDDFIERCLEFADRADDATQERLRARFEKRMKTLEKRLGRERDELERDRQKVAFAQGGGEARSGGGAVFGAARFEEHALGIPKSRIENEDRRRQEKNAADG